MLWTKSDRAESLGFNRDGTDSWYMYKYLWWLRRLSKLGGIGIASDEFLGGSDRQKAKAK
jgi:hypothetical protein